MQVTENSVDAGIHALAEKKLKLDAAVLDGLAASSKQTKIAENAGMTEILQSLLTGTFYSHPSIPKLILQIFDLDKREENLLLYIDKNQM